MTEFLSEESINLHRDYIRKQRLKYSILEKSIDGIRSKRVSEILHMRLSAGDAKDIFALLPEIELHEIYFSSFSDMKNSSSSKVRETYGAEGAMLNELYKLGMALDYGFVVVNRKGARIETLALNDYAASFTMGVPMLSLDVCEHAYFSDYGFDKSSYLVNALSYLNLGKIDSFFSENK